MSIVLPPSAAPRSAYPADVLPEAVRRCLLELAEGEAPVSAYLYDGEVAARRARELRAALPGWAAVHYAVKANSFPGVVRALAPYVDGFEVASRTELELSLAALRERGGPAGASAPAAPAASAAPPAASVPVVAAGPAKSVPVLTALVRAGVEAINAESLLELHRVSRIAVAEGTTARVALRVNPAAIPVTGSLHMGGAASQFGVPEPDVPGVLEQALRLPGLDVTGFHIHAASNNLDADAQAAYLRWCVEWSAATARKHGVDLRLVDVGGGIGVAFEELAGERPFDVARFGELAGRIEPPDGVKVVLEPGRFLVADCGWYAAEVTDVKHSYGTAFAVLRGGINHFQLPTSWDLVHNIAVLPVERWPEGLPRPEAAGARVTVVGELCTPEDTLLRDVRVDRVRAGDLVVFPYAGSYGWEFAMHGFLGHPVAERHLLRPTTPGDGQRAVPPPLPPDGATTP
ncbi:type III PLP-dependent enzyme [Streptomyces sp. DH37]|uniref:type III PLP-dependent enzyme n=1 Tax=Streptomyces sp. DH37 TaxID=3040122 RepID=UPI0024417FE8|nr:type III PLP-dependent enzyme [Streptomyces sp. DH37]MDG9702510.1 type III PLP-dependent enzyme [Streptomyces sp. DH37]